LNLFITRPSSAGVWCKRNACSTACTLQKYTAVAAKTVQSCKRRQAASVSQRGYTTCCRWAAP